MNANPRPLLKASVRRCIRCRRQVGEPYPHCPGCLRAVTQGLAVEEISAAAAEVRAREKERVVVG